MAEWFGHRQADGEAIKGSHRRVLTGKPYLCPPRKGDGEVARPVPKTLAGPPFFDELSPPTAASLRLADLGRAPRGVRPIFLPDGHRLGRRPRLLRQGECEHAVLIRGVGLRGINVMWKAHAA